MISWVYHSGDSNVDRCDAVQSIVFGSTDRANNAPAESWFERDKETNKKCRRMKYEDLFNLLEILY